jgi:hypothetical protein
MADSCKPHGNELVEVGRKDRAELDPLQKRQVGILGERQYSTVEVQPRQFSVEELLRLDYRRKRARGSYGRDGYRPSLASIRPSFAASTRVA